MRPRSLVVAAFVLVAICVGFLVPLKGAPGIQWSIYEFDKPTRIADKFVCGKVLFVHDMSKMAKGEPCTEIYQVTGKGPNTLITAFHCVPRPRNVVDKFQVTLQNSGISPGTKELKEYQFSGDDEGHAVPGTR